MNTTLEQVLDLKKRLMVSVINQIHMADTLIIALLTNGNVLLEGLPGTAKTRSIKALSKALSVQLGRVQFTPDLLPTDITGTEVYQEVNGKATLTFQPGPVFNNFLLADEINRSPAKVQAALLEAMEERQVTVAGQTHRLPELFMVLATQNPIEQEGTYPLPEAQMDRFLMKISLDYPGLDAEIDIIKLMQKEDSNSVEVSEPISTDVIFDAREQVKKIHCSDAIIKYIASIIVATRKPQAFEDSMLSTWIATGASPRASIALDKCARAYAWLNNKDFVDPLDVQHVVHAVLRHRIALSYDALSDGVSSDQVIDEIIKHVAVA
ncbi:MoxR family ATPase (plasmid) [Photobacterium sp. DA100]|uniref:AAA family ATPase n=1 Tax=Photobacterium sp. DA100 TaxID=3027472 RepID=UPI00247AA4DB|nr:MoxR family ATPase [Photobacterium sp. DA100]WEM44306.1 MoxR family ATPase [Photobacterium sp. DA100]